MKHWLQWLMAAPDFLAATLQQPNLRNPIAISFGAIAGALSRYYLGISIARRLGSSFPYGTFLINLSGSFAMGLFVTLVLERAIVISPEVRLFVAVGFLGSYTTFSTYELDTIALLRSHNFWLAGLYWLGSALLGAIGVSLGIVVARSIS
ncbi:fluoride efflux transporter CrcB [Oscillatoriales cyanobacterium LEGE 11467]|uniref:Fluoride-specific ion channel FluC n=1 Tax=Zarconia navalis LEGE 11467 TaxID=1828826 RepID=A0A928VY11_9CYAN|nr:fluoride efflux transporter CrcB [Zarconia navalis]MBE9039860.1 fluoride efflux transporter CrcB [Zarconia navalis LEGE 11467]